MGKQSTVAIIYKKPCCPQYSVLICGDFGNGWEYRIHDDPLTDETCLQLFADHVSHA